jgi:probable DNA metabolism protein
MRLVRLDSETDFEGWRAAARALVSDGVTPESIEWVVGQSPSLLGSEAPSATLTLQRDLFTVPGAFVSLARSALLHNDPARFGLLYRLLWRLRREPRLMSVASDADIVRLRAMADTVGREIHKTHAFVRFRSMETENGLVFIAWFEPEHHTLEAAAPFFVRRFASMRWSILTPRVSAHWDLSELTFGTGANRADAPQDDRLEDLWRTYYASIFNPARLKTHSMQAHMPRKYWKNMPESELIGELIARSPAATGEMIGQAPTQPMLRAPRPTRSVDYAGKGTLDAARAGARSCTRCPLYTHATQVVFGEGPRDAAVMFVGEQPGDREDLAGRPFIGPAGQLFDGALAAAGVDRDAVYLTNAVKHFKFEARGKRRLHKTPGQIEMEACRHWLEQEITLVQPRIIVALGATAAHSILGRPTPVQRNRGRLLPVSDQTQVLVTVHPSYLLRVPEAQHADEYGRFVADLEIVRDFTSRAAEARP